MVASDLNPFSLGILGDFCGHSKVAIPERRFAIVDRDSLDDAIRIMRPEAMLELPFCRSIRISSCSDFHPDQIAQRVPSLKALLYARSEVSNPGAMQRHLLEAGASPEIGEVNSHETSPPPPDDRAAADGGDLLDSMLGASDAPVGPAAREVSSFDRMLRAIVEESGTRGDFAREDACRAAIDEELSRRVRAILHHPNFQSLEASWTAVRKIIRAGAEAPLRLFDLRLTEVVEDAGRTGEASLLAKQMGRGADPAERVSRFSYLICAMELADDAEGQRARAHLSKLAESCGAPLVVGLCSEMLQADALPDPEWLAGRTDENVALVHPRVLLRLPYGEQTDPIDEFAFEEFEQLAEQPDRSSYLWGSAAMAVAVALASHFERGGDFGEIVDLPLHVYRLQGSVRSIGPVAELLSESRIKQLNDAGVSCIVGIVGADSARVVGLRSASGASLVSQDA